MKVRNISCCLSTYSEQCNFVRDNQTRYTIHDNQTRYTIIKITLQHGFALFQIRCKSFLLAFMVTQARTPTFLRCLSRGIDIR